jgi:hypothetical protein
MKTTIAVYDSHKKALDAIRELQKGGYPVDQLSLIGQAEIVDKNMRVKSSQVAEEAEIGVGVVAGSVLGVLTGVGIFAIPGLGFLYGAGAVVGAFGGLELGIIGGGLAAILTSLFEMNEHDALKYEEKIKEGKFMVVAEGNQQQLHKAKEMLHVREEILEPAAR